MRVILLAASMALPWAFPLHGAPSEPSGGPAGYSSVDSNGRCLVGDGEFADYQACESAKSCAAEHAGADELILECIRTRLGHPAPAGSPAGAKLGTTIAELSRNLAKGGFGSTYDKDGRLVACKVIKSTGDPELDRGACEVNRACDAELKQKSTSCMDRKTRELFARIVAERTRLRPLE